MIDTLAELIPVLVGALIAILGGYFRDLKREKADVLQSRYQDRHRVYSEMLYCTHPVLVEAEAQKGDSQLPDRLIRLNSETRIMSSKRVFGASEELLEVALRLQRKRLRPAEEPSTKEFLGRRLHETRDAFMDAARREIGTPALNRDMNNGILGPRYPEAREKNYGSEEQ